MHRRVQICTDWAQGLQELYEQQLQEAQEELEDAKLVVGYIIEGARETPAIFVTEELSSTAFGRDGSSIGRAPSCSRCRPRVDRHLTSLSTTTCVDACQQPLPLGHRQQTLLLGHCQQPLLLGHCRVGPAASMGGGCDSRTPPMPLQLRLRHSRAPLCSRRARTAIAISGQELCPTFMATAVWGSQP